MLNPIRKIGDVFVEYIRTHEDTNKKKPGEKAWKCWSVCVFQAATIL